MDLEVADLENSVKRRDFVTGLIPLAFLLLALTCTQAHAQARGGSDSSLPLLDLLSLVVVTPLLPLLAGAVLFVWTRSHLIAAGLSALGFGAWGAVYFSRLSVDGPLSGALYGLGFDGITSGLLALAGSGYVNLIGTETRRLGQERTAIVHAGGIGIAATAFVLLLVTHGSDKVGMALYLVMLAWSLGAAFATGSFGGVVATMAFALVAMVHGIWGAAILSGARDAGQAYLAIFYVPPLLVTVVVTAALGRWLGGILRARKSQGRQVEERPG